MIKKFLPFSFFDESVFWEMIHAANPQIVKRSGLFMRSQLTTTAVELELRIKQMIRNCPVSITLDKWTSLANKSFCAYTVHLIDDKWKLRTCCLKCIVTEAKDAVEMELNFYDTLLEYGISVENVVCVVSDTEATMNKFGKDIMNNVNGKIEWSPCHCHLLNLTAKVVTSSSRGNKIGNAYAAAKKLVGHYHHSPQASRLLERTQLDFGVEVPLRVIEDVETRWISTYHMIER